MAQWLKQLIGGSGRRQAAVTTKAREQKSAAMPLIALQSTSSPVWAPRTYAAFAREGMMRNAVVYRCVRLISEAAASVPFVVGREGNGEASTIAEDLLRTPALGLTGTDLMESWYGHLLVSGNAYMRLVVTGDRPHGLELLRPDRVRITHGSDGWPAAYEYSRDGGTTVIAAEIADGVPALLHLKLFHPDNDHYGLSPIEAAATAIDIHNGASRWNKALLDNAARPSGALVYSATDHMTREQYDRLKEELEESFQGARNAGRPLLLEGGLDWKSMSLSPRDMDFIAAKHAAARDIALALGVPPMLLGIPGDNTYANYQEANRTFWRQTVLPLVNRTSRALSSWLGQVLGAHVAIKPNLDAVEALGPEREALWRRLQTVSFLSDDEKRAAVGYPPRAAEADGS